jgi:transposase
MQGSDYVDKRLWWTIGYAGLFEQEENALREQKAVEQFLSRIDNVLIYGTELILDRLFHLTGFDRIEDETLRHPVIARLCQLSVEHTRRILGGKTGLVFYDVTALYFESDYGDELRETGFSKDGKHSQPQVVLGLPVSAGGYPLAYSLFNGSQYEGYTMLPVVEDFVRRFQLENFVVVAGSGLMNRANIALLETGGYSYIIGARIKNETGEIKQWILSLEKKDGLFYEMAKSEGCRLIVGYSASRAKKDAYNREKGYAGFKKLAERGK